MPNKRSIVKRESQAPEPNLAAMRMAREHEIAGSLGKMPERARIVEQHDPKGRVLARMRGRDRGEMALPIPPDEVHPHDLHEPRLSFDLGRGIDEEPNTVFAESTLDDGRCLVIVIAKAREDPPLERLQRT